METTEDKNMVSSQVVSTLQLHSQKNTNLSSILITGASPDSNLIHGKYAKMKIVIFPEQAKQSLYC